MLQHTQFFQHHPLLAILLVVGGIFYWVIVSMIGMTQEKFRNMTNEAFGFPHSDDIGMVASISMLFALLAFVMFVFPFLIYPLYILKIIPYKKLRKLTTNILLTPFMFTVVFIIVISKGTWKAVRGL